MCFVAITSGIECWMVDLGFRLRSDLIAAFASDNSWLCNPFALECRFADKEKDGEEKGNQDPKTDDIEILDS